MGKQVLARDIQAHQHGVVLGAATAHQHQITFCGLGRERQALFIKLVILGGQGDPVEADFKQFNVFAVQYQGADLAVPAAGSKSQTNQGLLGRQIKFQPYLIYLIRVGLVIVAGDRR